jgi:hypothetical protein
MTHESIKLVGGAYNLVIMLLTSMSFGVLVACVVYFNKIAENPSAAMGRDEALAMFYVTITMSIFAFCVFLWSVYKLLTTNEKMVEELESHKFYKRSHMD